MNDQVDSEEPEKLMTANEVAALLGVSIPTLTRWRQDGIGPRFLKLGPTRKALVRYRPEDVRAYMERCECRSTSCRAPEDVSASAGPHRTKL